MGRRHPKRFAVAPRDPRTKTVVRATRKEGNWLLELECGHWQLRRTSFAPDRVICVDCPPAGGIGGNTFGPNR